MTRYLMLIAAVLGTSGVASAQFPTQTYPSSPYQTRPIYPTVMPNIYNPANQPLSPYLNLLRGGNTGVNYYYGVRPGTAGGTGFSIGAPFSAPGGNRPLFFPQLANAPNSLEEPREPGRGNVLPPAGHPVVFGNTMGYFPTAGGGGGGGSRPGLAGVGQRR